MKRVVKGRVPKSSLEKVNKEVSIFSHKNLRNLTVPDDNMKKRQSVEILFKFEKILYERQ